MDLLFSNRSTTEFKALESVGACDAVPKVTTESAIFSLVKTWFLFLEKGKFYEEGKILQIIGSEFLKTIPNFGKRDKALISMEKSPI